jgi:hypothetical protein
MMRRLYTGIVSLVVIGVLMGVLTAEAAVKKEEKTQVKFTGFMGGMMKIFGGKAANEGSTETVAVKDDRKSTVNDTTGQLVDLNEEKVYDLDLKGRSYKVTTFDEIRQKFAEEQEKAKKEMAKMKDAPPPQNIPSDQQMEFDLSAKDTGQKKSINGFDCKEVVITISIHQKGKKLEDSGGMVTTMDMWTTPQIAALKEISDFEMRYYKKLNLPFDPAMMQQMAAMAASNPYLMQSMVKVNDETAKLDGTPVLTTTSFQTVASAEMAAQQAKQEKEDNSNTDTSVGGTDKKSIGFGILGGLAKRAMQKKAEEQKQNDASADTPGRSTLMSSTTELVNVSTAVSDQELAIPAGFKEKK